MALDRSSEARLRGSPMVREVGCSTNFALGKGLMAETSRTMVKWSASFDGCSGWRADLHLWLTPVAYCLFSAHRGNARSAPARPQRHLPAGEEVMARKWEMGFCGRICKSMSDKRLCISTSSACLQDFLAEGCVWGVLG